MFNKYLMIALALPINNQNAHGMTPPRIAFFGAATVIAGSTFSTKTDIVKPTWVANHIPNGIPKQLDDQVKFMKNPKQFTKLGAELPKGLLLYGPPGTGKTSIARAMAEELDATFISASGSDFTAHLYGKGSEKVKDFFKDAKNEAKKHNGRLTVAFIDEIDLIAPNRGSRAAQGYEEQITTFLTEIDGFAKDPKLKVYIVAATNRKEEIDPALLRAGRLENHILIPLPDKNGRSEILRHYVRKIAYKGRDISTELAEKTDGMSGADLRKLVNDAAISAGSEEASCVNEKHLLNAIPTRLQKYESPL